MKEITLCEKLGENVGITTQSWKDSIVYPEDFICTYADSQTDGVNCTKDTTRCPIYDLIFSKMREQYGTRKS